MSEGLALCREGRPWIILSCIFFGLAEFDRQPPQRSTQTRGTAKNTDRDPTGTPLVRSTRVRCPWKEGFMPYTGMYVSFLYHKNSIFHRIYKNRGFRTPRGDPREKMANVSMEPARECHSPSNDTSLDSIGPPKVDLWRGENFDPFF